jgi:hypothetical protein
MGSSPIPGRMSERNGAAVTMALSIVVVVILAYADMLEYGFTATDSLTLIETSRIQSFHDIGKIFNEPMMAGTRFVIRYSSKPCQRLPGGKTWSPLSA